MLVNHKKYFQLQHLLIKYWLLISTILLGKYCTYLLVASFSNILNILNISYRISNWKQYEINEYSCKIVGCNEVFKFHAQKNWQHQKCQYTNSGNHSEKSGDPYQCTKTGQNVRHQNNFTQHESICKSQNRNILLFPNSPFANLLVVVRRQFNTNQSWTSIMCQTTG